MVAARVAWMENSVTTEDAARWLEWDARDFERTAAAQGIKAGRFRATSSRASVSSREPATR